MVEEGEIESDSSEIDEIIPSLDVYAAKKGLARTGRIVQDSPPLKDQKKGDNSYLKDKPDGPLHKPVNNKKASINRKVVNSSEVPRNTRMPTVIVDAPDDMNHNESYSLQKNIDRARRSTLKDHFTKTSHTVATSASRKQKHNGEFSNDAKRSKSEDSSIGEREDEEIQENTEKSESPRPQSTSSTQKMSYSAVVTRSKSSLNKSSSLQSIPAKTSSSDDTPLEEMSSIHISAQKPVPPRSMFTPNRRIERAKNPGNPHTRRESSSPLPTVISSESANEKESSETKIEKDKLQDDTDPRSNESSDSQYEDPGQFEIAPLQIADAQMDNSGDSMHTPEGERDSNSDSDRSGFRPKKISTNLGSPEGDFENFTDRRIEIHNNRASNNATIKSSELGSTPGRSSSKYKSLEEGEVDRRTTRQRTKEIETKHLVERGEKVLKEALRNEYKILPDFYRLEETDHYMFSLDSLGTKNTGPPKPLPERASPDTKFYGLPGYINLPWSDDYVTTNYCRRGTIIKRELKIAVEDGFSNIHEFTSFIGRIQTANRTDGLTEFYSQLNSQAKKDALLEMLHRIVKLAARGPELITAPLPILVTDEKVLKRSVSLSQEQCACLLACSFLGLFPEERTPQIPSEKFPDFNLFSIAFLKTQVTHQKLRFILNYFANVTQDMPTGVVTFRRVAYKLEGLNISSERFATAPLSNVYFTTKKIEECDKLLQVDFANKFIGGGVLEYGFVQEEIRFLCCPEMMVSMLLCPKMKDNESIFIAGAKHYSSYRGYSSATEMVPLKKSIDQSRDKFRRIQNEVTAIDATPFSTRNKHTEYHPSTIRREINKAYAGFATDSDYKPPVATGHWGCGAFYGDLELKCIVQLIAASMAGRDIIYCALDHQNLIAEFCDLVKKLKERGVLLSDLYKIVLRFKSSEWKRLFHEIDEKTC